MYVEWGTMDLELNQPEVGEPLLAIEPLRGIRAWGLVPRGWPRRWVLAPVT